MRNLVACLLGTVAMLVFGGPAHAAWVRVETDKFIVYGQGGEKSVRDYATKLDAYDHILRKFHPSTLGRKPDTKVQVLMVRNAGELRHAQPGLAQYTAGFYTAMNEGVYAIAIQGGGLGRDDVIFHEYAHHFMLENFPAAYPAWFVEGFAEYFMTTDIQPNRIVVGRYNEARVTSLQYEPWVPMEQLLSKTTWQTKSEDINTYYGLAWLLMHYMRSDPTRAAQLDKSTRAIEKGEEPVKALQDATGMTLAQLSGALRKYRKLRIWTIEGGLPAPPAMAVTQMPPSADELFLDNVRLVLWPTGKVDAELLADVRRKAAKYPGDRLAETALARAEFVMGDVTAGEAIMRRRLASNPEDAEDQQLAGMGQLMAGIREAPRREERFKAARPMLIKAYQLAKTDFRTLYAYGLSRSIEPGFPNDNDVTALLEARYLAPSVTENSYRAGMALLARGRREEAVRVLAPVLNNPHCGKAAEQARKMLVEGQANSANIEPPDEDEEGSEKNSPPK